jgi:hypothetical protein
MSANQLDGSGKIDESLVIPVTNHIIPVKNRVIPVISLQRTSSSEPKKSRQPIDYKG